jgi:hypothetical protein
MRKIYLLLLFSLILELPIFAQENRDQVQVAQICVDLPDLQSVYPVKFDGLVRCVFAVSEQNVVIPKGLKITGLGVDVCLVQNSFVVDQKVSNYLVFKKIDIADNTAVVVFEYNFLSNSEKNILKCNLTLNKSNDAWSIGRKEIAKEVNHE